MLSEISLKLCVRAVLKFKPLFLERVLLLTFYILDIQVSIVHLPPSPPGYLSGVAALGEQLPGFVAGRVLCRTVEGWREGAWLLQSDGGFSVCLLGVAMSCIPTTVDLGQVHVKHLVRCFTPEHLVTPASGTSLLVPAGGLWQHPNWLLVGRDLRGSASLSSRCWRRGKPLPKQTVVW